MVKSYYLIYGAQNVSADELGHRIGNMLGMDVELRESLYVGPYVRCIGQAADTLTIESDKEGDGTPKYKDVPFSHYHVFVEVSNTKGKNFDKEARNAAIKQAFSTILGLVLLKETLIEKER